jgi:hypothetical protein
VVHVAVLPRHLMSFCTAAVPIMHRVRKKTPNITREPRQVPMRGGVQRKVKKRWQSYLFTQ